jgi:hypothetical protein
MWPLLRIVANANAEVFTTLGASVNVVEIPVAAVEDSNVFALGLFLGLVVAIHKLVGKEGLEPSKEPLLRRQAVPFAISHNPVKLVPMTGLEPAKPAFSTQYVFHSITTA